MNVIVLGWSLVVLIFVQRSLGCDGCTWKRRSVSVLAVFDTGDISLESELDSAIANRNYESQYDEKECLPRIRYNVLYLNDSLNELDAIREAQTPFQHHEYCVIVFAAQARAGKYILEYAAKKTIPVVNILMKKANHSLFMPPSACLKLRLNSKTSILDQMAMIAPTLKSLKWKKMAMIYDNSVQSLQIAASLEQTLSINNVVMMNSTYVTPETDLTTIASKLDILRTDCSSFVILTENPRIISSIFRAANWLELLGQANMWLLLSNVGRKYLSQVALPYELFVVHPDHEEWTQTALIRDAVTLFHKGLRRMTRENTKNDEMCHCRCECASFKHAFYRSMLQSEFTGETGLVKFDDKGERRYANYDISVIAVGNDGQLLSQVIGVWDGTVKISTPVTRPKLRVIINEYPPNIMTVEKPANAPCPSGATICVRAVNDDDGTKRLFSRCCYGFAIDVLHLLKGAVGFEPELRFSEDGQFGVFDEKNQSWNGIVRELLEDKGDITLDLYISARRATVLDFTEPYAPSGIRLLVKERSGKGTNIYWLSYLRPFTTTVWLTLLGSMGIMIVFLWIVEKFAPCRQSRKIEEKPCDEDEHEVQDTSKFDFEQRGYAVNKYEMENLQKEESEEEGEEGEEEQKKPPVASYGAFGLDNAVCFTLALAFGRPADEAKPMLHGARLASVGFGVAMMMLISSYSANLAAFLIVEDKYTPVESIYDEKIAKPPPGFRYGTVKGSYMADFFANAESAYMRNMWYHMRGNNVESSKEGVRKVKSGELDVFISDHISLMYESLNDLDCELKVVGEPFAMSGASLAVPKGSPWFTALSDVMQELKSKDLTDFIQKFWVQKYKCSHEKPPTQLQIQDLSGLFLQLAIASVACFMGTFIHNYIGFLADRYGTQRLPDVNDDNYTVDQGEAKDREEMSVLNCKFTRMNNMETDV